MNAYQYEHDEPYTDLHAEITFTDPDPQTLLKHLQDTLEDNLFRFTHTGDQVTIRTPLMPDADLSYAVGQPVQATRLAGEEPFTHTLIFQTRGGDYLPPAIGLPLTPTVLQQLKAAQDTAGSLPTAHGLTLDGLTLPVYILEETPEYSGLSSEAHQPITEETAEDIGTGLGELTLTIKNGFISGFGDISDEASGSAPFDLSREALNTLPQN